MPGRIQRRAYAAVALAIIIFFVHQPVVLSDEGGGSTWTAVAASGQAFYKPGDGQSSASWRPLTRGTAIAVSGQVKTGPDGEVTLVRGKDTIELSPQTVIEIAPSPSPSSLTRVIQKVGKAFFSVDSIPGRSFKAETPRLVAGVLGTQFVVVTTPQGNGVSVDEGRVEVAVLNGAGGSVEIGPGQTASLNSSGQLVVDGAGSAQNKGGRGKGDKGNNGNRGGGSARTPRSRARGTAHDLRLRVISGGTTHRQVGSGIAPGPDTAHSIAGHSNFVSTNKSQRLRSRAGRRWLDEGLLG